MDAETTRARRQRQDASELPKEKRAIRLGAARLGLLGACEDAEHAIQTNAGKMLAMARVACDEVDRTPDVAEPSQGDDRRRNYRIIEDRKPVEPEQ
jgi:hypothetical protein